MTTFLDFQTQEVPCQLIYYYLNVYFKKSEHKFNNHNRHLKTINQIRNAYKTFNFDNSAISLGILPVNLFSDKYLFVKNKQKKN